jgi:hypothetical protein
MIVSIVDLTLNQSKSAADACGVHWHAFLFYFFQENSPDLCTKVLCFVEVFEHLLQEFSLVYFYSYFSF